MVRTKVEKLSKITPLMDHKVSKRVTEAICLSSLTYCLAAWGHTTSVQKKCQKAMNCAIRMLVPGGRGQSMTDGLASLGWLNMTNLWRMEQIYALWRVFARKNSDLIFRIITSATNHRYMVRSDGIKSSWWPRNGYGEAAFVHQSLQTFNDLRIGQKTWVNWRGDQMTKKEIRDEIKYMLRTSYDNSNLR